MSDKLQRKYGLFTAICMVVGIVIGSEGGMSAAEVDALTAQGAKIVTLGPRILRAETAAVASVTMAMTLWGDL